MWWKHVVEMQLAYFNIISHCKLAGKCIRTDSRFSVRALSNLCIKEQMHKD